MSELSEIYKDNPYVPKVKFELIKIKNLHSSQAYQRNLSISHVNRTAEHFNVYQVNPVKVSRRNGINYVFNGQHTIETIAQVSGSRETPVWCMIYDDLEYQEEADIFANQSKYTKMLSPYEIFNANIEAQNPDQLTIKKLVENYNLKLSSTMKPNCICGISALEFIFKKYGINVLSETLYLVVSTWEGDAVSLSSNILKGTAKLLVTYGDRLDRAAFSNRLSRVSPKEITRSGKERNSGSFGFAEALLAYYNKRTKYPLPWNLLYSGKKHVQLMPEAYQAGFVENTEEPMPEEEKAEQNFAQQEEMDLYDDTI